MCDRRAANGAADRSAASEEEQILKITELCEIDDLLDRHPYDLSGGEQQRTALAKVMLTDPKILLLDEPTKGMDSFFKQKFARVLKRLQTEGVTVVMVSHDVEFCARYADLTGMFFDGSIVTVNTPEKFFARNSFYTTAANRDEPSHISKCGQCRGCDRAMQEKSIKENRAGRRSAETVDRAGTCDHRDSGSAAAFLADG